MATPIGNLRDVTLRALDVLRACDLVAAEDTRHARVLLEHHGLSGRLLAVHRHNEAESAVRVVALLAEGKSVGYVSDAGTPGVSDPGAVLVRAVREAGYPVIPVPGPSAAVCALSASGLADPRFLFLGFLPAKPASRRRELERWRAFPHTVVLYEAPHRIDECLADLEAAMGSGREVVLARELTKMFEEIHACRLGEARGWLAERPERVRGEFVVLVAGAPEQESAGEAEGARVVSVLARELAPAQAARLAAALTGCDRDSLYRRALAVRAGD